MRLLAARRALLAGRQGPPWPSQAASHRPTRRGAGSEPPSGGAPGRRCRHAAAACCGAGHQQPAAGAAASRSSSSSSPQREQQQPRPPRFYAPALPACVGGSVELDPDEARHALRALRLRPGDALELCDGRGGLVACELAQSGRAGAAAVAVGEPVRMGWAGPRWVLAAACLTLKGGRGDWLVEKATELGAHALLPLVTERAATGAARGKFRALASKAAGARAGGAAAPEAVQAAAGGGGDFAQPSRLQRLALAATKQSLRAHALQLEPPTPLSELLPALRAAPLSLVATAGASPVLQVLREAAAGAPGGAAAWCGQPCYLLVGPEGDWTPSEVAALAAAGVRPVGLGTSRLRTETAALALLSAAVLQQELAGSAAGAAAA
ncbi:rsmE [Scenedesmus sp. PABB004]|nr:rsmE [Scenedesmus sp. PABB004]